MIRGVLFDNDGTLVDTYNLLLTSYRYATKQVLSKDFSDEKLMAGVGTPLEVQACSFTDDPAVQEELVRVYREYNHAIHDDVVKAFPGMLETLAHLHAAGVKLGVVTAKRHALAWRGLEIVGAVPYLEGLIGPDDCPVSKPDPTSVLMGAEMLGLAPEECLYVGDSPFDIQAGNAAGCPTVAVTWGMFDEDVLRAEKPTYVINTFEELEALCMP